MRKRALRVKSQDVDCSPVETGDLSTLPISEIDRCRTLLGDDATDLTDVQIEAIRRHAIAMAHILIDLYLQARSGQPTNAE
jgi:hypothetical protein